MEGLGGLIAVVLGLLLVGAGVLLIVRQLRPPRGSVPAASPTPAAENRRRLLELRAQRLGQGTPSAGTAAPPPIWSRQRLKLTGQGIGPASDVAGPQTDHQVAVMRLLGDHGRQSLGAAQRQGAAVAKAAQALD